MWGWICFIILFVWLTYRSLRNYDKDRKEYDRLRDNIKENDIFVEDRWEVFEVKTQSGDIYVFSGDRYEYEMNNDCEYIEIFHGKYLYKNTFETVEQKAVGKGFIKMEDTALPCRICFGLKSGRPISIFFYESSPDSSEKFVTGKYLNKETGEYDTSSYWENEEYRKLIWDYDRNIID